jgi:hypothetical protein
MLTRAPVTVLLAFANDWVEDRRHLRNLLVESKAIHGALAPLVETGTLAVPPALQNATVDDVISAFRDRRARDRIRIFHFGGHASGSMLLFEDAAGRPAEAHASGLARYLGQQRGLVLVFLNGCCTEPHVRRLREAGVKAVVATTHAIHDEAAAEFARAFYAELATRSLREAFAAAMHVVQARWGDVPGPITRDIATGHQAATEHEAEAPPWPWIFDCDPDYEGWTLGRELTRRIWRTRLLVAAVLTTLVLMASFTLSAGVRQTACSAPGLHALCARLGFETGPTTAEHALWDSARRQRSREGLQAYLRSYPRGVYAEEARSRLQGCRSERVETFEPARDRRFPLTVNARLAHLLPSEAEARADAQARGNEDAAWACQALQGAAEILSAVAEPRRWDCKEYEHRFSCGFDGETICHVKNHIAFDRTDCFDGK